MESQVGHMGVSFCWSLETDFGFRLSLGSLFPSTPAKKGAPTQKQEPHQHLKGHPSQLSSKQIVTRPASGW